MFVCSMFRALPSCVRCSHQRILARCSNVVVPTAQTQRVSRASTLVHAGINSGEQCMWRSLKVSSLSVLMPMPFRHAILTLRRASFFVPFLLSFVISHKSATFYVQLLLHPLFRSVSSCLFFKLLFLLVCSSFALFLAFSVSRCLCTDTVFHGLPPVSDTGIAPEKQHTHATHACTCAAHDTGVPIVAGGRRLSILNMRAICLRLIMQQHQPERSQKPHLHTGRCTRAVHASDPSWLLQPGVWCVPVQRLAPLF